MNTALSTTLGFAPLSLFWTLSGFGYINSAAAAGLCASLALNAFRLRGDGLKTIELAALGFLAAFDLALLFGFDWIVRHGSLLASLTLGVTAAAGLVLRRPWSAEYSKHEWPEVLHDDDRFIGVNMVMSGIWAAIFLFIPFAAFAGIPSMITGIFTAVAAIASVFAPDWLVRHGLRREIALREPYNWPLPSFSEPRQDEHYHAAIIGAGIGGLTCAALLAKAGLRVIVAEQHVVAGGFCHTWLRKCRHNGEPLRFRFDSGVHDISGCHEGGSVSGILDRLDVGGRLNWLRQSHEIELGGERHKIPQDPQAYIDLLCRKFPAESDGIGNLFETIRAVYDAMYSTGEHKSGVPGGPLEADEMLRFPKEHPMFIKWQDKPFVALLDHHIGNRELKDVLLHLAGYLTGEPETLTVADMTPIFGYYFKGGYYPEGGSGKLADVLCAAIRENGGTVLLKSPVEKIDITNGRASGLTLKNGRRIQSDIVISNADLPKTFGEMLTQADLAGSPLARANEWANQENAGTSAFCVHLGLDRSCATAPISQVDADGLSIGIASPSLVDPTAAPPGFATMELIALMPRNEAETWVEEENIKTIRRSSTYKQRKTLAGDRLIDAAEKVIPDLRKHIVYRCDASPLTFHRYDLSTAGAIYGVEREARFESFKTPVPNLVYVGASGKFGSGIEAVMISGALAAEMLRPGILAPEKPRSASFS